MDRSVFFWYLIRRVLVSFGALQSFADGIFHVFIQP